jgi:DNA polymerase III epsilon subunit-like protein
METVFIDTETTGLNPGYDEVLQIGVVSDDGRVLMDTLIRPTKRTQWHEAQEIHGIAPTDVVNAPTLAEVLPQLADILRGAKVVIYNAAFDTGFLPIVRQVAAEVHCCMLAFADHYGEWNDYYGDSRWQRLTVAADYVMHDLVDAHNAVADCQACRAVHAYLTDPAERARVDALREQRRIEQEAAAQQERIEYAAKWALETLETIETQRREKAQKQATVALMRRLGMSLYQPGRLALQPKERDARADEYCRLFFGVPLVVAKYEADTGRTLPGYSKRSDVPAHMKSFSHFKNEPIWLRNELVRDAYLCTAKSFSWLYDVSQIARIWARHPLRRPYQPPAGHTLVTRTHLKRVLKLKDAEIAAMAPVVEVESQYQGWIPMYLAAGQ